ncbi:DUF4258 domain-containing protein [Blautia coccoides]|nr:DUF4258 domain-containing protein [Blautia coccoides]MCQ4643311.1 DUF4258 domain-containing protein [Blautia coccoides]MCQ5125649.1 DUF4258 domain-containing protein [Blautia producta]
MNRLENIAITKHAKERLRERGIKVDDITHCMNTGEIIRQYEDFIYLITAYYPDVTQWEADLKTRKER